ncbi:hypothetical protein [Pelagovum pacificum]|uniref:Chemotaxis protein CheA n=1 Tax=Pelagovum pacificum TaxID=2588711 RepID=A0A5C5G9H5_9RHOB|nr:hypothetical protein [Pelagovum pacificum]QQA41852.1 hypothetical protein I8N54_13740 [Pelagovum pacificum]TNY30705.1 hypothetical protein FHY64_19190 [Pelagovum pacificum]
MAEPSKILTVSYGTFSCTLEGFDDAFDTMKAIAEYFRDLAADDRYFGAEPPTPDPEMLARIAEREVERRVEARRERGGYILRPALGTAAAAMAPQQQPASQQQQQPPKSAPKDDDKSAVAAALDTSDAEQDEAATEADKVTDLSALLSEDKSARAAEDAPEETATAEEAAEEPAAAPEPEEESVAAEQQSEAPAAPDVEGSEDETPEEVADLETDAPEEAEAEPEPVEEQVEDAADDDSAAEVAEAEEPAAEAEPEVAAPPPAPEAPKQRAWADLTDDEKRWQRKARAAKRELERRAEEERKAAAAEQAAAEAEEDAADGAVTEAEAVVTPTPAPVRREAESVAAKLARIRAVVGQSSDDDIEDEPEDATASTTDEKVEDEAADIAAFEDEVEDDVALTEVDTVEDDEPEDALTASDSDDDLAAAEEEDDDDGDSVLGNLLAEDEAARTAAEEPAPVEVDVSEAADETEVATDESDEIEQPKPAPIRARVVRMKRSDFEASLAAEAEDDTPAAAQVDDEVRPGADVEPPEDTAPLHDLASLDGIDEFDGLVAGDDQTESQLSEEDEAALLDELAEVERIGRADEATTDQAYDDEDEDDGVYVLENATPEIAEEDEPDTVAEERPAEEEHDVVAHDEDDDLPRRGRGSLLTGSPESDEASMSRILSETDAQLQEPEGNRRRQAIAHLKAAVAATEAARRLGENSGGAAEGEENIFRDDLDQVVRPRRAVRPENRSDRPRPAPLKLVASQRVDVPGTDRPSADHSAEAPVRPRRVTSGGAAARPVASSEQDADFARFAADVGAASLTDLLEAAAAHEAFVEGHEDVSRPHIMKKVQAIMTDEFTREDGLRAFGTLLRQGRIEKVRNGRFQVSSQTRFRPVRAASGD